MSWQQSLGDVARYLTIFKGIYLLIYSCILDISWMDTLRKHPDFFTSTDCLRCAL